MSKESVDKTPDRIQTMFDGLAPWYDFLNHAFSLGIDRRWRRRTTSMLLTPDLPEGPILDVCCGTGDLSFALHQRSEQLSKSHNSVQHPPRKVHGVDFSSGMIDIAQKKITRKKNSDAATGRTLDSIEFVIGDALDLPFESRCFAAVANAFGLRNVGETQRGLAEMVRVCRPGGKVVVLEFSMPTLAIFRIPYQIYFRGVMPIIGQFISQNRDGAYRYFTESVLQFDSPVRLVERLESLGLVDIRTIPLTFGIATLTVGRLPKTDT